jgi:hypothetical protein
MHRSKALLIACGLCAAGGARAWDGIEYNRDIRPILSDACFRCHGPDSAARQADLRLDVRDAAIETGAIAPGKPEESELVRRILSEDPDELMPPASSHKSLTQRQKELLQQWIAAGAEYQPHWSLIPPQRPPVPAVRNASWVRNPIDAFILARLEAAGLEPAEEADRRTLARRASLDLTGLPPSPEDVESFVNDASPNAYAAYVDRLMDTMEWGEHRGRYWLDYARYADTHGIHFDNYREIWAYRDWVIRAFAQNMPFDQFTIENLAGDLLPNRTLDQLVASGFNRCNITTNEGGAIAEEYLVLYTRDRTETTAQVWLGTTANCAVCHDHKFDPLSQKEFYQMAAFFNNTTQPAMDGNVKDTPPTVVVPMPEDRERYEALGPEIEAARKAMDERVAAGRAEFDSWLASAAPRTALDLVPREGLIFHAPLDDGTESTVRATLNGEERVVAASGPIAWEEGHAAAKAFKCRSESVLAFEDAGDFEKDQAFSCAAWVKLPGEGVGGSIAARMDEASLHRGWDVWLENGRLGAHIIHQWPGDAIKVVSKQPIGAKQWRHVVVTYDGGGSAEGVKLYVDGAAQEFDVAANSLKNSVRTSAPLKIGQRNISARINGSLVQDVRLYGRALSAQDAVNLASFTRAAHLLAKPAADRTQEEVEELFRGWLQSFDEAYPRFAARLAALAEEKRTIESRGTVAHVMNESSNEAMAYVLYRGEYDQRRDPVKPETPQMLPPMAPDLPRNRLGFARWLLQPEHPLTARVTVNRFWQEVFGTGLVKTSGDFGVAGELPSHPELLDWLAVEFRESGWNVKELFRLMLNSATYRQSAATTPEKLEKDPENRLLSRGPRFRMDAEMVRDYALAVSGLLTRKHGGPSVKPYQPPGVWEAVAMIGSNTRDYKQDSGENLYRRSMYTLWKRAAPPASMEIFNAPNRETCTVRRERTNTPLQALVTLNDPQFVEAARRLAERTLRDAGPTDEERIDAIGRRIVCRPFRPEETAVILESLADLSEYYATHAEDARALISVGESKADPSLDATQLAAWTMLVNQLMNLDEALNK